MRSRTFRGDGVEMWDSVDGGPDQTSDTTDQKRNLNPIPEAVIAMLIWGEEYSEQRGGSMDFWDSLSYRTQEQCREMLEKIRQAMVNHGVR